MSRNYQQTTSFSSISPDSTARFLSSHNPAQVKRNVLASFTSVLLLPVTIVPRTMGAVGGAIMTGGTAAVQGIAMLNPQRWGGNSNYANGNGSGYSKNLEKDNEMLFEAGADEQDVFEEKKSVRCKHSCCSKRLDCTDKALSLSRLIYITTWDTKEFIFCDRHCNGGEAE